MPLNVYNHRFNEPLYARDIEIASTGRINVGNQTSNNVTISSIYTPLQINSGSSIVVVDANGNVGIGTLIPTSKLQVVGDVLISGVGTLTTLNTTNINSTNINSTGIITTTRLGINTTSITQQFQVGSGTSIVIIDNTGEIGIGTTNPTSKLHIVSGDARFEGVTESVASATTYLSGSAMVLELDARAGTAFTYTMPTNTNIGIVSFKNLPAETGRPSGTTITLIVRQASTVPAGTGNTSNATGIGTNCFITGYENGTTVTGISTRGLVGSATTVTLSTTGSDVDFVSFFVNYDGGINTSPSSYNVYVSKNGGFRRGTIGV